MSGAAIVLWLVFGIMGGVAAGWCWALWQLWQSADEEDDK